ncbi:MAG: ABC transporter substrate-binding protein [Actinomycetota bacterium]|nr:ABC transporter substrate-binding protein [Actinomycetota bacterium]
MTTLRASLVTPLTGSLAGFGRAGAAALNLWAGDPSGLPAGGVDLSVIDAHPEPAAAMRQALAEGPEVIFGPYGSSPALEAIGATGRAVWNHGGASSALRRPRYPHAINVLAPASTYLVGALRAVRAADPAAATVSLLRGSTGFALDVAGGAVTEADALGFSIHVTGFDPGGATEAAASVPAADVLLVVGSFEDEMAAAGVLLERHWGAAAFVGAGVDEVLAELGDRREGLLGPAQWLAPAAPAEPEEGPDAAWFTTAYRQATGHDPPYPAVAAFAAGVLCSRCLRDAGDPDDAAMLDAARRLDTTTLFGRFRLDPDSGLQAGHEVLTVQWQDGARRVVWPPGRAEPSLRYPISYRCP